MMKYLQKCTYIFPVLLKLKNCQFSPRLDRDNQNLLQNFLGNADSVLEPQPIFIQEPSENSESSESSPSPHSAIDRVAQILETLALEGKGLSTFDLYNRQQLARAGPIKNNLAALNYGCFCANLRDFESSSSSGNSNLLWGDNIGTPKDDIDAACKGLINGWTCLRSQGVDVRAEYNEPSMMDLLKNNVFGSVHEVNRLCADKNRNDPQMKALCQVEMRFSVLYANAAADGSSRLRDPTLAYTDSDRLEICHPYRNNNNRAANQNGVSANSNFRVCCDSQNYPFKTIGYISEDQCMQ